MIGTLLAGAAMAAALVHLYRRDQRQGAARRARAFEACRGMLDDAELSYEPGDYPGLCGRRDGYAVELKLISENVNIRKLPALWLLVTVRRRLAVGCAFDMLLRAQNTEFYSPHARLAHRLPTPEGWPEHASIRCGDPLAGHGLIGRLAPHVAFFNEDPRAKELLVGPGGVRLVYLVDEATRSRYLTLRQAVYERDVLDRDQVERLVGHALAVAADLAADRPADHVQVQGPDERSGQTIPPLHGDGGRGRSDGHRAGAERTALAGADDGLHRAGAGLGQL